MRAIATDGVGWSVCVFVLVTAVSPAKTTQTIDMSFGRKTPLGLRIRVLDGARVLNGNERFRDDIPLVMNASIFARVGRNQQRAAGM